MSQVLQTHALPSKVKDPLRIFEIYETSSQELIISCPNCLSLSTIDTKRKEFIASASSLANRLTIEEIEKRLKYPKTEVDAACTHHSHSKTTAIIEPFGLCRIEAIVITYSSLTFSIYLITPTTKEQDSIPYPRYMHCLPDSTKEYNGTIETTNK